MTSKVAAVCYRLKGKVAVVTASTDGIGFSIAKHLGAEGASVMVSSRNESNVLSAVKTLKDIGYNVAGTVCHVANADQRKALFEKTEELFGGIDILVSNAAVNPAFGRPIYDCSESEWDKIFEVNVKAPFMLSKEVLPYLHKRNGGSIIYCSSIVAFHSKDLKIGAYAVSKTSLLGLTKAFALELATKNIRVNCVAPGLVDAKFSDNLRKEENLEACMSLIPMKRMARPEEISPTVTFLASDDASYITGETIVISGGTPSRL